MRSEIDGRRTTQPKQRVPQQLLWPKERRWLGYSRLSAAPAETVVRLTCFQPVRVMAKAVPRNRKRRRCDRVLMVMTSSLDCGL